MRFGAITFPFMAFFLLSSCGFTDSGDGSGTLRVNLAVEYTAADEQTDCMVTATITTPDGHAVTNATVEIVNGTNSDVLVSFTSDDDGVFQASFSGYERNLELSIVADEGFLDAALEGPSRHVIASPWNGDTIRRRDIEDGLSVQWHTEDGLKADEVVLRIPEKGDAFGDDDDDDAKNYVFQTALGEDEGQATIPSANFGEDAATIEVLRRNTIALEGGYDGSLFVLSYSVSNNIELVE